MEASRLDPLLEKPGNEEQQQDKHRELKRQMLLSCCIMFAEGFYATQIFPYGPWMTGALRGTEKSVGFYTGLVYTAQSLGMLCSAYFWAHVSDKRGRRFCLLCGLAWNTFSTIVLAFSGSYWLTLTLRLFTGLMNSNLPIMRTALREIYQYYNEEDTEAFSTLSVAFGASTVAGPSLGGLLYDKYLPGTQAWMTPWSTAMLTCTLLYGLTLIIAVLFLRETAFLGRNKDEESTANKLPSSGQNTLLRDKPFLCLLMLGGGHSYVFTGWETTYPLLARIDSSLHGEQWSAAQIGLTFLVGSVGLMLYSRFAYARLASRLPRIRLWTVSWIIPLIAIPVFPRFLTWACENGFSGHSRIIVIFNYGTQTLISVLLGSGFITVQLLLNTYISERGGSLAVANSMLTSTQALVRALSPMASGALFTLGLQSESRGNAFPTRSLPFDSLVLFACISCVFCAIIFEKLTVASELVTRT